MKRILLSLLAFMLLATTVFAGSVSIDEARSIARVMPGPTVTKTGGCIVYSIAVTGTATGDQFDVYDGVTKVGATPVYEIKVGTANNTVIVNLPTGIRFSSGIYTEGDSGIIATIVYE